MVGTKEGVEVLNDNCSTAVEFVWKRAFGVFDARILSIFIGRKRIRKYSCSCGGTGDLRFDELSPLSSIVEIVIK